jgi:Nitroreductase family
MTHRFAVLEHPAPPDKVEASLLRNDGSLILPRPRVSDGKSLMRALKERHSSRELARGQLPMQLLSDLLWAAFGVNRTSERGRTAPSAVSWLEIDIYVALREGVYVFDSVRHALMFRLGEDVGAGTKMQDFVSEAPLELLYVADFARVKDASDVDKLVCSTYSVADARFIAQNVCLFCAAEGLDTVVRRFIDRSPLSRALRLAPDQRIVLAQTVGFPAASV